MKKKTSRRLTERDADAIEMIEDQVLETLALSRPRDAETEDQIRRLETSFGKNFYSTIIRSLTGLVLPEEEARHEWDEIVQHKFFLSQKVGRDIGIHVAALDYLRNIRGQIRDVRIVDADTLAKTVRLANTDGLTGLYNHRVFQEEFSRFLRRARRSSRPFALCLFDLDHFKRYNDTLGHLAGDVLLFEVARILLVETRDHFDIPARYGGEEFALLLRDTGRDAARDVAERIRRSVEELPIPPVYRDLGHTVSLSGGIAVWDEDGNSKNELLSAADRRLYKAKESGRNRIITTD